MRSHHERRRTSASNRHTQGGDPLVSPGRRRGRADSPKPPEDDLQRVTDEVANLSYVPFEVSLAVLEEFQELMSAQDFVAVGGQDVTARLLVKAFGENGAKSMVQRLGRSDEMNSHRVDSLKKADPQQLARFLVGEHSQTKALILGHLDAKQASALLMKLEPEMARRLCEAPGESGEVFTGSSLQGFVRAQSPIAICGRSKQALRQRLQKRCRAHESPRSARSA